MKVLVDTNVILDLLAKREDFYEDSMKIFSLADEKEISILVSSLSLVNTHYILHDVMKLKEARSILGKFKVLVRCCSLNDKMIELALNDSKIKDFEVAVQYYTASEADCKILISRNKKDFKHSSLSVMSPKEFLAKRNATR